LKKGMILCAVISSALTALLIGWYWLFPTELSKTLAITMGTIAYHFVMRLLVGAAWSPLEHRIRPDAAWYRERAFEAPLYKFLRVRAWKHRVPTYDPDTFDARKHSLKELLCATCHSERVHETIIVLSFLPLIEIAWFGTPAAFWLTSIGAALFDSIFVVVQRYNRPRLRRLIRRQQPYKT